MSWLNGARARMALLFSRREAESRMNEEVRFHIEMETERLIREEHLSADEANRRARATFGGVTQHTETLREGHGLAWLGGMSLDIKLALRMLRKNPGLTLVAVVGMAIAVTIGAVMFSAVSAIIDSKLPFAEGERVVAIRNVDTRGLNDARATHLHDLVTWRGALTTVSEIGAYRQVNRNLITGDGHAESFRIAEMSASGFRIARTPPVMGRYLNDDDERPGSASVAVIGEEVWKNRFSGRADIIGHQIDLGDERYTIVGVMPSTFRFPVNNTMWTALRLDPAAFERGHAPSIDVFAKMKADASIDDVRNQLLTIGQRLNAEYPKTHAQLRPRVVPYTRMFIDNPEAAWTYHLVQLLVSLLLLVIGTNVAILVYARTASRMGEIAVRTALGASRSRIVTQLFAEALAMSLIAAGVGLVIAHFVLVDANATISRIQGGRLPAWQVFHITTGVIVYSIVLAIVAAVIVGVVPGLKATGKGVRANLQLIGAGGSSLRLGKTWTFLVITEVAIAVAVLPLSIAGLSRWERFQDARQIAATRQVLSARLSFDNPESGTATDTAARIERFVNLRRDLVTKLEAEPSVAAVVFSSDRPGAENAAGLESDTALIVVGASRVDLNYFTALSIPLLAGRGFEPSDYSERTTAVIVSRSVAGRLFNGASPLGRRIRAAPIEKRPDSNEKPAPWELIVGVVPDFPVDSSTPSPKVYRPLAANTADPLSIALRMKGASAAGFTSRMRELAVATNPLLRIDDVKTLEQTLVDSEAPNRILITVIEAVTLATVLLSAAGIYALMAFTITRRRREIGIRSALGAGARRVLVGVLSRAMVQVGAGIIVGVVIAALMDNSIDGGWTGRRPIVVLPGVAVLMIFISLCASAVPALRALRIQPTEALKSE